MADPLPEPSHPFRAKGIVYQAAHAYYDEHVPGGWDRVVESLAPDVKPFFAQIHLASAWYDAMPLVPMTEAAARVAGTSFEEVVTGNARWMARRDLTATYRFLFKVLAPGFVAPRLPTLSLRYFQLGEVRTVPEHERLTAGMTRVPRALAPWLACAVRAFVEEALQISGASRVTVESHTTNDHDVVAGVPTCTLHLAISWSTAAVGT